MAETEPIDVGISAEAKVTDDGLVAVKLEGAGLLITVAIDPDDALAMAILPGVLEQVPVVVVHSIAAALGEQEDDGE